MVRQMISSIVLGLSLLVTPGLRGAEAPRPTQRLRPTTLRTQTGLGRATLESEMQRQTMELEAELLKLKADHTVLMQDLKEILEVARQEKADRTVQRINVLISKKEKDYETAANDLERKLQRLKAVAGDAAKRKAAENRVGTIAPKFELDDYSGHHVRLADYQGKVIVLAWISPNCKFTQYYYSQKTLQNLAAKYTNQGVVWLAINSDRNATPESVQAFALSHGIKQPILNDTNGMVARLYHAQRTPQFYIIDTSGKIVYSGPLSNSVGKDASQTTVNYVDQGLSELLAGKPLTMPYAPLLGTPINLSGR